MSQSTTSMFSDYIVYVDESRDQSLETINRECPLFCCRSAFSASMFMLR